MKIIVLLQLFNLKVLKIILHLITFRIKAVETNAYKFSLELDTILIIT